MDGHLRRARHADVSGELALSLLDICSMPVIAAPMAGGPSTPRLVVEAARAGSLGMVPGGYRTVEQLAADLAAVRTLSLIHI